MKPKNGCASLMFSPIFFVSRELLLVFSLYSTGLPYHYFKLLTTTFSVYAAYGLGNILSRDIYTVIMDAKNLPYLPGFRFPQSKLARDVMVKDVPHLVCYKKIYIGKSPLLCW